LPALDELCQYRQWLPFKFGTKQQNGKRRKIPINARGLAFDWRDPDNWLTYEQAQAAQHKNGIGVVTCDLDPFTFGDLDNCRDPETGALTPEAIALCTELNTFVQPSPSGTGIRFIARATLPGPDAARDGHELYSRLHFATITNQHIAGTPTTIEPRQAEIEALYARWFPPRPPTAPVEINAGQHMTLDDSQVIGIARHAKDGAKFRKLYDAGDASDYTSPSEADQALFCLLAFYTGKDTAQMERLARQSTLHRAHRWNNDYITRTISYALDHVHTIYTGRPTRTGAQSTIKPNIALAPEPAPAPLPHLAVGSETEIAAIEDVAEGTPLLELLGQLMAERSALKAELETERAARLVDKARLQWIDELLLDPRPELQDNDRLSIYRWQRMIERNDWEPGQRIEGTEDEIGALLGTTGDKAGRTLDKLSSGELGSPIRHAVIEEYRRNEKGEILKMRDGRPFKDKKTVVELRAMPLDLIVTQLVSPRSIKKDGTEGTRHGGDRRGCTIPGCTDELKKVTYWTCPTHGGIYNEHGLQLDAIPQDAVGSVNTVPHLAVGSKDDVDGINTGGEAHRDPPCVYPSTRTVPQRAQPNTCPTCCGEYGACGWPGPCANAYLYPPGPFEPSKQYQTVASSITPAAASGGRAS
jgi:hypothetical protein